MAQTTLRMAITRWTSRAGWVEMLARAPRAEFEQAGLRLIIWTLILAVLIWRALGRDDPSSEFPHVVWFVAGFVIFAVAVTLWTLSRPHESPLRRILGIIADNAGTTYFMLLMGENGAVVVAIYLFVAFGNGFRFGNLYLRISHGIALVGFALVLYFSDFWPQHYLVGLGWFIALLVLPFYVGTLSQRLKAEKLRADQALKECREALKECRDRERGGS